MKIYFEKEFPVLLFGIALVSLLTVVSLPRVESVWTGLKAVYSKQDFGLSILREAMLVGLTSQQGTHDHFDLDGRIADGGKLVWKTPVMVQQSFPEQSRRVRHEGLSLNLSSLKLKASTKKMDDKVPA